MLNFFINVEIFEAKIVKGSKIIKNSLQYKLKSVYQLRVKFSHSVRVRPPIAGGAELDPFFILKGKYENHGIWDSGKIKKGGFTPSE